MLFLRVHCENAQTAMFIECTNPAIYLDILHDLKFICVHIYVHRRMNALTRACTHTHTHTHTHRVRMCAHLCILYSGLLFEEENLHKLSDSKHLRGKIFRTVGSTY